MKEVVHEVILYRMRMPRAAVTSIILRAPSRVLSCIWPSKLHYALRPLHVFFIYPSPDIAGYPSTSLAHQNRWVL